MDFLKYLFGATSIIIFGGLVTTVAGFIVAYRKNPPHKLLKRLAIVSLIGGVLVMLGGVWAGFQQAQSDSDLIEKTERITQLTQRNADYVIGGDSYCYFNFAVLSNRVTWILVHNGEYPLYDLEIRTVDVIKREIIDKERPGYITANYNREAETTTHYGTLPPHDNRSIFKEEEFTTDGIKVYQVNFFARNGSWRENICFLKKDGKWLGAWHLSLRSSFTHRGLPEDAKSREGYPEGFPSELLDILRK